jgi:hypothetical protein
MEPNRNSGFLVVVLSLSALISLFTTLDSLLLSGAGSFTIPFALYALLTFGVAVFLAYGLLMGKDVTRHVLILGWFFIIIGTFFGLLDTNRLKMEFYINIVRGGMLLGGVWLLKQKNS